MNELSHLIPSRHSIGQQGIDEQAEALVAQILPDEHIDPFRLYPSAQVGPVVLSVPHGGWQYPKALLPEITLSAVSVSQIPGQQN